jgi:hypothetical protein
MNENYQHQDSNLKQSLINMSDLSIERSYDQDFSHQTNVNEFPLDLTFAE